MKPIDQSGVAAKSYPIFTFPIVWFGLCAAKLYPRYGLASVNQLYAGIVMCTQATKLYPIVTPPKTN